MTRMTNFKILLAVVITCVSISARSARNPYSSAYRSDGTIGTYPDYKEVTIPANIAPLNCHTHAQQRGDLSMFYIRGKHGGAILNRNGELRKLTLKSFNVPDIGTASAGISRKVSKRMYKSESEIFTR